METAWSLETTWRLGTRRPEGIDAAAHATSILYLLSLLGTAALMQALWLARELSFDRLAFGIEAAVLLGLWGLGLGAVGLLVCRILRPLRRLGPRGVWLAALAYGPFLQAAADAGWLGVALFGYPMVFGWLWARPGGRREDWRDERTVSRP